MPDTSAHSGPPDGLRSALGASLIMAVGLGYGRFAFTAVYPLMVKEGLITIEGGTFAASANYTGYLLGALLAIRIRPAQAGFLCLVSAIGTALCLAPLAWFHAVGVVALIRGVAGLFSAMAVVSASLWLLQHRGHVRGSPFQFGGVGLGIVLSSLVLILGQSYGLNSPTLWLWLSAVSLLLGLIAYFGLMAGAPGYKAQARQMADTGTVGLGVWQLVIIYAMSGFGYIITATYLPLFIKGALGSVNPIYAWAAFGLGAAPSCFLWHGIQGRLGSQRALLLNLVIQAFGVLMPVVSPTGFGFLASAVMVGATFMGTVTIAMSTAQRLAHTFKGNLMAVMTVGYGTGQIVGPLVTHALYEHSHSFSSSLMAAGIVLLVAAILCARRAPRSCA